MQISLQKNIKQKKQSPFKGLINVLILIVALPVIIIAGISLSIYFIFLWLKNKVTKPKSIETKETVYHLELDLVRNDFIHIILVEDEFDDELTQLNETWGEIVYDEETYLYRAKTNPLIPALEGTVCCFYFKEVSGGVLLQVVPGNDNNTHSSQLVYLDYKNLELSVIDETGLFFLYNDKQNLQLIKGFNKKEDITIQLNFPERVIAIKE